MKYIFRDGLWENGGMITVKKYSAGGEPTRAAGFGSDLAGGPGSTRLDIPRSYRSKRRSQRGGGEESPAFVAFVTFCGRVRVPSASVRTHSRPAVAVRRPLVSP